MQVDSSRMVRTIRIWLPAIALAATAIACALGPTATPVVPDADAATAAAKRMSDFDEPVRVLNVERGRAGALYRGARGGFTSQEAALDDQRKQATMAWLVVLRGPASGDCVATEDCRPGVYEVELVIGEASGELLYSLSHSIDD